MRRMEAFAFVRHSKLDRAALIAAERHGKRNDRTSAARLRDGAESGAGLAVMRDQPNGWVIREDARDLRDRLKAWKAETGARENPRGRSVLHSLIGVSPEWIEETGDLHDPKNPRVRKLLEAAVRWAEAEIGGVFAARIDLDERGGGVVDVFAAPVHTLKFGRGKERPTLSPNRSLDNLAAKHKASRSFGASQTSWANYARKHLDPAILRGKPVKDSKRRHLSPEEYGQAKDLDRELRERERAVEARERQVAERERKVAERERDARDLAERERKASEREGAATELARGALLLFDKIVEKFRAPALALLNDPKLPLGRLRAVISSAPREVREDLQEVGDHLHRAEERRDRMTARKPGLHPRGR